ncbi:carbohydrate-binding domain-containing protein [Lancefieldella sp. Marseille-Q7238]|uniref:carbohydrate-binding domain-containing protein n=1 Tax=Lancefieldella sp. Marseille-Q7238 TaxID=3022127 RepID=UPI0024A8F9DB|nr:carbohydrate-binding domain-containing protein [Lancefieldella sp. Marseille-Q7238]
MFTDKNINKICMVVLVFTLLLTVAFINGKELGITSIEDQDAENYTANAYFTDNDQDGDWADNAYTTHITLNGTDGTISGNGAYFQDGNLVIANGGWYEIAGTLDNGSIIVKAENSSKVWIRLNGVSVTCTDDACLRIDQAEKVFLSLAEGTDNTFTSGDTYSEEALADNTGGTIYAHDDLTINGTGNLTITAGYKHGIDANDSLVITGGNITITAPQDGIHVNDGFSFTSAHLTIDAGDDGIHSDTFIYTESGTILVNSCYEGLEAKTIDIAGGNITIYPTDDGINANGDTTTNGGMGGGPGGGNGDQGDQDDSGEKNDTTETTEEKETYIHISGGTVTIINTTGNDADGLDSNGSIYINGGTILISLPGGNTNNAIDYGSENNGKAIVTGGTVIGFGGSGMAEEFSSDSTQVAVLYNLDETVEAGTTFRVLDQDGTEILAYTPTTTYSSIAFSSPQLAVGKTYTIEYGDTTAELTIESTAQAVGTSGGMGGGPGQGQGGGSGQGSVSDQGGGPGQNGDLPSQGSNSSQSENTEGGNQQREPGGTPPQQNGGNGGPNGQEAEKNAETDKTNTTTSDNFISLDEIDETVWKLLGGSILVLIPAIVFAMKYKKS